MTWWQIYLLAGMVVIGAARVTNPEWRPVAKAQMEQDRRRGFSPRQSFFFASAAIVVCVLIWPIPLLYWVLRWRA